MASSYATFRKVCAYHKIPPTDWKFNGQYHYIEFRCGLQKCPSKGTFDDHGSRIDLLDLKLLPSDPMFQRFGSTEYTGGWIEEAGEVNFMAFDVLKARVGRWMNQEYGLLTPKILLTCNPEQNWLYRIFYKPWRNETLAAGYAFIQSLWKDNPYTAEEAGKRLEQITDKVLRARLKMGLWEYASGDNSLLTYDQILDMFTNTVDVSNDRYLSADVARYGSDKVTIGDWVGFDLHKVNWKEKRSIPQTAEDIRLELRDEGIPYSHAIADDDGVGGGVVDLLPGIKGFVGNSSPLPQVKVQDKVQGQLKTERKMNYKNLRSQCGFMLADYVKNHRIAVTAELDEATKEMMIEDLQQLKKKEVPIEAPLQLIPKDEIKEALGRSPDFGDMMLMRMYFLLDAPQRKIPQQTSMGGVKPIYEGMPG